MKTQRATETQMTVKPIFTPEVNGRLRLHGVSPVVHDVLRLPGHPLDPATRAYMEPRFAHDFSQVRVHTDAKAAESARAMNALAYTVGQDVMFGEGQYAPQTRQGQQLLVHELAHTVQQAQPGFPAPALQRRAKTRTLEVGTGLLLPSPQALLSVLEAEYAPIYQCLDEIGESLRLLSIGELATRVRRAVPESRRISRADLENIIRNWGVEHNITFPITPLLPQPQAEETAGFSDRLIEAIEDLKDQVEEIVNTLMTWGSPETIQAELGLEGIETTRAHSGFRFSWTIGWRGQLGGRVSTRVFNGELSFSLNSDWIAPEDNPSYSATLQFGPGEPDYGRFHDVFTRAGRDLTQYVRGLVDSASDVNDQDVSDVIDRISDAADQVEAMTSEEDFPPLTFGLQVGSGRTRLLPAEEGAAKSPMGIYGQLMMTCHF